MSAVTILWSMIAAACLTLALIHGLVWWWRREAHAHLLFAASALSTTCLGACELWMMRAATPEAFGQAVRWLHVPAWAVILALVGFVRLYLRAGRPWLAWTVCGVRTLSLAINFLLAPNLNYRELTGLQAVPFLGDQVTVGIGRSSPWMLVGQASLVLLVFFVADATVAVWRRGDRRQAVAIGGSILFFTAMGSAQVILVFWGMLSFPVTPSLFYSGIIAAMGYELSRDVLRAARLADDLRESQESIRLAAAAARLAIWNWDLASNQVWMTPEGRSIFGFPLKGELTIQRFMEVIHPDDRPQVDAGVAQALRDGGEFTAEFRVQLVGGAVRWVAGHGQVEFHRDRRPARMRGVSLDVTARKFAELEAHQHRNEVAHLARVSTLGEITGSLAHELNQPLGAILSNAEAAELLLQSERPDLAELRAILADIRADDLRAGEILRGLRAFLARRELGRQPLEVARLVNDALRLIAADRVARRTPVDLEVAPDLPRVSGDPIHLQQVLLNLLLNALDAMDGCPASERRVTLRAVSPSPGAVALEVRDAGCGVPGGDLQRVFDPFHTTKPGGLGLGLAICRTIVEAHGGSVHLENNPGRGATARVVLPAWREGGTT